MIILDDNSNKIEYPKFLVFFIGVFNQ